ncbi:MAG TPA: sulfotransferase domain-containing protein [Bryobacteraceae bacterium]|nr:sulfotransferase domain-containing protein [Bryobacteraceae bacterium]
MPTLTIYNAVHELPALPPHSQSGGGFVFAIARGGSSLMNSALRLLTNKESPVAYMNLPGHFYEQGITLDNLDAESLATLQAYLGTSGIIFGGWRARPRFALPIRPDTKTFLLVRDPRDVLTSLYYYQVHVSKKLNAETTIDDFVRKAAAHYHAMFSAYNDLQLTSDLKLCRYEDIVFDKPALLRALSEHFSIGAPKHKIERIAALVDKQAPEEAPGSHVRQVRPGDHLRKLKPKTIAELSEVFQDVLRRYGYSAALV